MSLGHKEGSEAAGRPWVEVSNAEQQELVGNCFRCRGVDVCCVSGHHESWAGAPRSHATECGPITRSLV